MAASDDAAAGGDKTRTVDDHTTTQDRSHDPAPDEDARSGVPEEVVPAGTESFEVVDVRAGMFGVRGTGDTSGYGGMVRPVAMPPASRPPFGPGDGHGWFDDVHDRLATLTGDTGAIEKVVVDRGEITFFVRRVAILDVVRHLRDDAALRFELCSSLSAVHFPHETDRELHVVYHLLSMTHRRRVRVETTCPDADPHVPSVVAVYPTADWQEREAYDMFGVVFDGHPALTRILMPDDWQGHPQRKDYPLGGIPVEYKGGTVPSPDHRRSYS
jgi:NADH-quinone oxidoreductase subunit C